MCLKAASWGEGLNRLRSSLGGSADEIQVPVYHHPGSLSSSAQGPGFASASGSGAKGASLQGPPVWSPSSLVEAPSCDRLFYSGPRIKPHTTASATVSSRPSSPPWVSSSRLATIPSVGSIKGASSSSSAAGPGGGGASMSSGLGAATSRRGSVLGGTPAGPGSSSGAVSDADGSDRHQHDADPQPGSPEEPQTAPQLRERDLIALATLDCSKEQAGREGGFWSALLPLADLASQASKEVPNGD